MHMDTSPLQYPHVPVDTAIPHDKNPYCGGGLSRARCEVVTCSHGYTNGQVFLWILESPVDMCPCGYFKWQTVVNPWEGSMNQKNPSIKTNVVFVGNQKGGVGKTTNTINIAAGLAERGKSCLIIDCDMTGGATKALGVPMAGWHNTFDLITRAEPAEGCIITEDDEDDIKLPSGIHLIPATKRLADLQAWLLQPEARWLVHQDLLLEPISVLRGRYDYIFIDTPPQVTTATLPALKAADFAILSTFPEEASTEQIGEAMRDIRSCQQGANPALQVLGIVVCAMPSPPTVLARELLKYLSRAEDQNGRGLKFETNISRTTAVGESRSTKQTLFAYAPAHKVTDQYRNLVREVEARVVELQSPLQAEPQSKHVSEEGAVANG